MPRTKVITDDIRLLLNGAIRKNKGNGLPFYAALRRASTKELRWALARLQNPVYKWSYPLQSIRASAVERELKSREEDNTNGR